MANRPGIWTRRQVVQGLAASVAGVSLLSRRASALSGSDFHGLAFVGSSTADVLDGSIHVFRVSGPDWRFVHSMQAAKPAHLSVHPTLPVLYVVHDVSLWDSLPRGAVSAYRFHPVTGALSLENTRPLSLSAVHPRYATVAADGRSLFVSAEKGGIYNLLSLNSDGSLGPVTGIRKEFGLQDEVASKVSAPGHTVVHPDGHLFAADTGQETVTRFDIEQGEITLLDRKRVYPGTGPSQLAVSPCGRRIYAMNGSDGTIAVHRLEGQRISPAKQSYKTSSGEAHMLMHPNSRTLIVSGNETLSVLRINKETGHLSTHSRVAHQETHLLRFTPSGTQLIGLAPITDEVTTRSFDLISETLSEPDRVAQVHDASSLLLYSA